MVLTLIRDTFTPSETLGRLLIDRQPFCGTLEPPVVPNALHPKGCVPQGWYRISVTCSPKFGRPLPLLRLVPGFEGIRIHAGNVREHTAGCILVGIRSQYALTLSESRAKEEELVSQLLQIQRRHEEIYIDITDIDRYPSERDAIDRVPDYPIDHTLFNRSYC